MAYQDDIHPLNAKWYAVMTGPRHEKFIVNRLRNKGIEAWTPLTKKLRIYKTKTRKVELPLITRYVFVKIVREEYISVIEEKLVHGFLHNQGRIYPVKDEEILILKRISGEEVDLMVTTDKIEKGDRVEIIYGELTGLKGEVIKYRGKKYFGIVLDSLGMNMLVDVPKEAIYKIK